MSRTTLVVSLLVCVSCLPPKPVSQVTADASYDNIRWVRKAARALWREPSLNVTPQIQALAAKPRQEIIQEMMKDPRFSDSLFDFFLYFLGAKSNNLEPEFGAPSALKIDQDNLRRRPQAPIAAKEAFFGRDFSVLFDLNVKTAVLRNGRLEKSSPQDVERAFTELDAVLKEIEKRAKTDAAALCKELYPNGPDGYNDFSDLQGDNGNRDNQPQQTESLAARARRLVREAQIDSITNIEGSFDRFDVRFSFECFSFGGEPDAKPKLNANAATAIQGKLARSFAALPKIKEQILSKLQYEPIHISDIEFDTSESGFQLQQFWSALPNSSTNYNRKRAEYMLKTYFCDELTPLKIVAANSDMHAKDRHASDAGCRACHYKLDPMAGYFRYYGAGGQYNKTNLSFDDGKVIGGTELEKYLSNWRAEGGSRQWNVGYIRSNTDPRKNHFGDDLKDLFAFIKTAPEVRQCLVKRLAKYYVSDSQAFDGDWLAQLGKPLQQAPQSGAALKQVIAGLIASNSFAAADPKADQCYDYVGGAPTSPVPCAVAHILKEKCSACHSADNAEGGLDLTNWRNGSFPHIRKGQPVSKADTIATIQERIDSANPDLLMPQSGELSAQERQALFSWLQSQQGGAQ